MADSAKLAKVVALLAERDEDFRALEEAKIGHDGESLWAVGALKRLLGYEESESIESAIDRAKIVASKNDISIRENFRDGNEFGLSGETVLTMYAVYLTVMHADETRDAVALAKHYFALQIDRQLLEDEKRLKMRLDVTTENHKLQGAASGVGVSDFKKFNGVGVSALYGGRSVKQIQRLKGLKTTQHYLDYAGSEELAANLFRITQTAASLRRQVRKSEAVACATHKKVGESVREVIRRAGNTLPENLPAATTNIGVVATAVGKRLADD